MPLSPSITVTAELKNLPKIIEFVRSHTTIAQIDNSVVSKVDLVLEELFVNVAKYSYQGTPIEKTVVEIHCTTKESSDTSAELFVLTCKDFGAPFNPLEQTPPALDADLDVRQVGGLGVYLVELMADSCSYTREKGQNIFHACFSLGET